MNFIQEQDPQLWQAIEGEMDRQQDGLEMIASENYTSPAVMQAAGSVLTNKYAEGYPGRRESPAFKLMELLQQQGAELSYNDPHIPTLPTMRHYDVPSLASEELTSQYLSSQDCVLIVTDHSAYNYDDIVRHAPLVVDTRNATVAVRQGREKIHKA